MIHWFYDSPNIACFSRLHNSTSLAQQPTSVARACFLFLLMFCLSLHSLPLIQAPSRESLALSPPASLLASSRIARL